MSSKTTTSLFVLAVSAFGVIALIHWTQGDRGNTVTTENANDKRKVQPPSVARSSHLASSSGEADEKKNLMEELLQVLPGNPLDPTLLYAGGQVMEVEGLYIDGDADSESVIVIGLTKITLMDGSSLHTGGDDATMIVDSTTGTVEIEASSLTMVAAEPNAVEKSATAVESE